MTVVGVCWLKLWRVLLNWGRKSERRVLAFLLISWGEVLSLRLAGGWTVRGKLRTVLPVSLRYSARTDLETVQGLLQRDVTFGRWQPSAYFPPPAWIRRSVARIGGGCVGRTSRRSWVGDSFVGAWGGGMLVPSFSTFCQLTFIGRQQLHWKLRARGWTLTLIVLMWRIGWAHNNARK